MVSKADRNVERENENPELLVQDSLLITNRLRIILLDLQQL
jgi:hypothetical protein